MGQSQGEVIRFLNSVGRNVEEEDADSLSFSIEVYRLLRLEWTDLRQLEQSKPPPEGVAPLALQ
jgi:hypothetical protein